MSAVVAGTKAKLQNLFPNRIGDNKAFSTSYVESLIMAGFYDACERCNLVEGTERVALVDDTLVYDLAEPFIEVLSVELFDGSSRVGHLTAVTLDDLDKMDRTWRNSRGAEPEYYTLLSAPGIPETSTDAADGSRIQVWRPMSTAGDYEVWVNGIQTGTSATHVPGDVQRLCLVPYVMAHLKAVAAPDMAAYYMGKYLEGCEKVRGRFSHKYDAKTHGAYSTTGMGK
jgi:hypothetical protein